MFPFLFPFLENVCVSIELEHETGFIIVHGERGAAVRSAVRRCQYNFTAGHQAVTPFCEADSTTTEVNWHFMWEWAFKMLCFIFWFNVMDFSLQHFWILSNCLLLKAETLLRCCSVSLNTCLWIIVLLLVALMVWIWFQSATANKYCTVN